MCAAHHNPEAWHAAMAVRAAAGTGKTWLLTSRLIRLLLQGVTPGSILAITFTRKAASEIYQRVLERLLVMASTDKSTLAVELKRLNVVADDRNMRHARRLFEQLLSVEHELRATTFHAFCQDILRRFPLEAEVTPGFELLESTNEIEETAWQLLESEATAHPHGTLAHALDTLLRACGGTDAVYQALTEFLTHRSDWWAYTESFADPVAGAHADLQHALMLGAGKGATRHARWPGLPSRLKQYVALLRQAGLCKHVSQLERATDAVIPPEQMTALAASAFFTQSGRARTLTRSKRLVDQLGAARVDELLALHAQLATEIEELREQTRRHQTLTVTAAWYHCGERLIHHYQHLKVEQQMLDFADLEWKAYRLLNRSQYAEWIQYKLDQRIDHLLVDEFQDTNPTQWRLLLPLLQEMAAGGMQRRRSVFLVGDEKQSIYGFRRADPGLFNAAQDWLIHHMAAHTQTQDKSWRSSGAIIDFINFVYDNAAEAVDEFGDPGRCDFRLSRFRRHHAHHQQRWGRVELLPLIRRSQPAAGREEPLPLRDPLTQARRVEEDLRYRAEGELVAQEIMAWVGQPIDDDGVRTLDYGDFMILLRDRTHAAAYEAALRRAGIPYVGAGRGTFMQCLEVQDLLHLLQNLASPYDDLALASALRSPIFNCDNDDLALLAASGERGSWRQRLSAVASTLPAEHALACADALIRNWAAAVDRIPAHDLLDRIYRDGDVVGRYVSAAPAHLKTRVRVNLYRLLQLALEVDHGRYPSLGRFLARVPLLADEERHALAEAASAERGYVSIMTIHAAKGLEMPVVFLVDAMRDYHRRTTGMRTLVDWPVEAMRPRRFQLIGAQSGRDQISAASLRAQEQIQRREETNLLYVALTRAKHALFISGCEPARGAAHSWYAFLEDRIRCRASNSLQPITGLAVASESGGGIVLEHGAKPQLSAAPTSAAPATSLAVDAALTLALPRCGTTELIYPSRLSVAEDRLDASDSVRPEAAAKSRGIVIHRMLQLLTTTRKRKAIKESLARELASALPAQELDACWNEACAVLDEPAFAPLFDSRHYQQAYNELAILYRHGADDVYGVIDRLIVRADEVTVLDYKTHAQASAENVTQLARAFSDQLRLYREGVKMLWPGFAVRVYVLFTAPRIMVDMTDFA